MSRPIITHVLHRMDLAGAEVLADGLARALAERFESRFLCLDGVGRLGQKLSEDGFEVIALGRRPGIDRNVIRHIRRVLRDRPTDILHAHQYTPFFYAAMARPRSFMPGRKNPPVVFTEHGRHYPDRRSLKRVRANRLLLSPGDRVTAVSWFVRQALIRNEAIPPGRVQVIYNGIDPMDDKAGVLNTEARSRARQMLGLEPDVPVVIQVARFHSVKDHATAVKAFAKVHEQLPDARLVMVGDGPQRSAIAEQVRQSGLDGVVLMPGLIEGVRQVLPGADVAMLSSLSEGLSVTLLEAMAASLPVATTDVGGNGELIAPGITGLLSPRQDAQALANNLITLLRDADQRQAMGQAGRTRLLEMFTEHRMHEAYAALYLQVLGR